MITVQFIQSDLGNRNRGDVLEVTLSNGANVRLLDSSNFQSYRNGRQHRYHGGLATKSPVRIPIPSSGHWYAVVDMQGLRGSTRASFRVIPGSALRPLPPIEQRNPGLAAIAENVALVNQNEDAQNKAYDVFISHASEDKDEIVRPLAIALQEQGLSVWYDEFELRIGDSLRQRIDAGISKSRFGIVVLSEQFFAKGWTQYELDGLVTMSVSGRQILLPLWHKISKERVIDVSPSLADKVALQTSEYEIEEIAAEIAAIVHPT
ncbi:MAG: hypothetical protein JWM55_1531 [Acidimicrobiaceae bacterium]|nr:hypothetical protein [Acidimicrobiaceae bacterium]